MRFNRYILHTMIFFFALALSGPVAAGQLESMQDELQMRISFLKKFNKKHERALVNVAQDETFKNYFAASSETEKKKLKKEIDQISLAVQGKFKVDEMCLIDNKGQEISRIVFNEIAPEADLSDQEASASFFSPGLDKGVRKVHIERPYLSADSLRWVVCYVTPIVADDGSKPGIYHFEVSMYSIQKAVNRDLGASEDKYLLLVNKEGYVMSDSRKKFKLELDKNDKEMNAPLKDYYSRLNDEDLGNTAKQIKSGKDGSGSFEKDGSKYTVAYKAAGYFGWSMVLVQRNN